MSILTTKQGADIFADSASSPREVFGKFIHENELSVLFGDSNAGKSILSNDIAFFVCGGNNFWGQEFASPMIPSMYIDMEMTQRQFVKRYLGAKESIPNSYSRVEVNVLNDDEDLILKAISANIIVKQTETDAPKFIVIDNITNGFGSILSATKMKTLITHFKNMKNRFGLTMLLIAHCPKRKPNTEITGDNLGGSKMILNFVDSAFAIAPSLIAPDIRYLKQIKCRACPKYEEVAMLKINDDPYVHFEFVEWNRESQHLTKPLNALDISPEAEAEILRLLTTENCTYADIAKRVGIPKWKLMDYVSENKLYELL